MNPWELPVSITVHKKIYSVRTDFRVVLDALMALNDPDLFMPDASEQERAWVQCETVLRIMVEEFDSLPVEDYPEAYEQLIEIIDCGMKDDGKQKPHTMDWKKDAPVIIPAVNRIQGTEIRALPYLHWWTFMGAYMEIGECLFSQIVSIRLKNRNIRNWKNGKKISTGKIRN